MPVDVTVTGIEYVPGGVAFVPFCTPEPPLPLMPPMALVQLDTPAISTTPNKTSKKTFRRCFSPRGSRKKPQASSQRPAPESGGVSAVRLLFPV